ncbi:ABC transporter permease [Bifidobacterium sp. MA2]|uniref:ABC transporter permease n=1 Tax=Bifidobacterium santillanense TaxID=2809028 RepID=A0ABS5UQP1_9BIFI|nr:TraX family protein [Bifidobacterium santillanense]MBT1173098.1 ABC transporter permease [Bifidobacterium santillanense]
MHQRDMARPAGSSPALRRSDCGLTAFRLKVIGAVFMALSVASTTLMPALLGPSASSDMLSLTEMVLCEVVSWCAVPIYAWLLVEGFRRTRNVWAYAGRLAALAVVCEVPYDLTTSGRVFDMSSQNPVFGLLIALIVLALLDWVGERGGGVRAPAAGASPAVPASASRPSAAGGSVARALVCLAIVVAGVLWNILMNVGLRQHVLYVGALTLGFALVFRYLAARENTMMITAGLLGAMMLIVPAVGVIFLHYRNGEPGCARPWTRWAFYAVYPVLLLVGCLF